MKRQRSNIGRNSSKVVVRAMLVDATIEPDARSKILQWSREVRSYPGWFFNSLDVQPCYELGEFESPQPGWDTSDACMDRDGMRKIKSGIIEAKKDYVDVATLPIHSNSSMGLASPNSERPRL